MNFWSLVQKIWEGFKHRQTNKQQTTRSGPPHSHRRKRFVGDKKRLPFITFFRSAIAAFIGKSRRFIFLILIHSNANMGCGTEDKYFDLILFSFHTPYEHVIAHWLLICMSQWISPNYVLSRVPINRAASMHHDYRYERTKMWQATPI